MMFTRVMDKLSKIVDTTTADNDDDPATHNESLSTINEIPCESVEQLQLLNDALPGNKTLTKLLVCTIC